MIEITESSVRDALRAVRYGKALDRSPLLHLAQVEARLGSEGLDDSGPAREWAFQQIAHDAMLEGLAHARGGDVSSPATLAPEAFLASMPADFERVDIDREAWSVLVLRHVAASRAENAEVAARLAVTKRTLIRRLNRGYELLAGALREREAAALRALRDEAGELRWDVGARKATAGGASPLVGRQTGAAAADRPLDRVRAAAVMGVEALAALDPDDLLAAARHVPESLDAYWLVRLAEWSRPRHRLDERFVELTMLVEGATHGTGGHRAAPERFDRHSRKSSPGFRIGPSRRRHPGAGKDDAAGGISRSMHGAARRCACTTKSLVPVRCPSPRDGAEPRP